MIFFEIHISCPQHICEERDVKGFYRLAREGIIKNYTGVSSPYEEPEAPALCIRTDDCPAEQSAETLLHFIVNKVAYKNQ